MASLLYGAVGAVLAILLVGAGFALGRLFGSDRGSDRAGFPEERDVEAANLERRRLEAERAAFQNLLTYNVETAYGMRDD